ncbi:MAG: hypothetical protein R8K20_02600 [Gallionellaceae bacterium]
MSIFEDLLSLLGVAKPKNLRVERKKFQRHGPEKKKTSSKLLLSIAILFGIAIGVFLVVSVVRLIGNTADDKPAPTQASPLAENVALIKPTSSDEQATPLALAAQANQLALAIPVVPTANETKIKSHAAKQIPVKNKQPAAKKKSHKRTKAEVRKAVIHWAKAWSRRNVKSYLACYAGNFSAANGMSRAEWKSQRKSRIGKPHSIKVRLKNIKISMSGNNTAIVRFSQSYRADRRSTIRTGKELRLINKKGHWLIIREKVY